MFRQLLLLALVSMVLCQVGKKKVVYTTPDYLEDLDAPVTPQSKPVVHTNKKIKPVPVPAVKGQAPPSPYDSMSIEELLSRPLDTESLQQILIRAQPGKDYPIYSNDAIPQTSFSCANVHYPGYYADVETDCQVFHFCPPVLEGLELTPQTFICPNLTRFNNRVLVCDWFFDVDCKGAPALYDLANSRLYQTALPLLDDVPEVDMPHNVPIKKPIKKKPVKQTAPVKSVEPVKPVEPVTPVDDLYDAGSEQ